MKHRGQPAMSWKRTASVSHLGALLLAVAMGCNAVAMTSGRTGWALVAASVAGTALVMLIVSQ